MGGARGVVVMSLTPTIPECFLLVEFVSQTRQAGVPGFQRNLNFSATLHSQSSLRTKTEKRRPGGRSNPAPWQTYENAGVPLMRRYRGLGEPPYVGGMARQGVWIHGIVLRHAGFPLSPPRGQPML